MHVSFHRFVVIGVAALLLAGCGNAFQLAQPGSDSRAQRSLPGTVEVEAGSGPLISRPMLDKIARPNAHPAWMKVATGRDVTSTRAGVYVSQFYGGQIDGYSLNNQANSPPICTIPGVQDVNGIAVDQSRQLYVPQEIDGGAGGGEITEYKLTSGSNGRCGKLLKTLTSTHPLLNAAIDSSTVYGMDNVGASQTLIEVWANGSTTPTGSLTGLLADGKSTINGYAIAIDSRHDIFVSVYAPNSDWNSEVIEFVNGQMPAIELTGTLVVGADFPAGVLVDKQGNLLVVDPSNNSSLAIYAPPYTGAPSSRIGFNGGASYCALNKRETRLYCTDYEYGSVDVYKYPTGAYLYSFTSGLNWNDVPEGMALRGRRSGKIDKEARLSARQLDTVQAQGFTHDTLTMHRTQSE